MDLSAIRVGLATTLDTVEGLRAKATLPEKIDGPTAVISPDDSHNRGVDQFITYNDAMAGGLCSVHFEVVLLVPLAKGFERAQNTLDGYLSAGTGETTSAVDALNAITGVAWAEHVMVAAARKYASLVVGTADHVTASLAIVVRAPRR